MMSTIRAIVREGKVELLESMEIPEGTEALVTLLTDADADAEFWRQAAQPAADAVWGNLEDDIYAELLAK